MLDLPEQTTVKVVRLTRAAAKETIRDYEPYFTAAPKAATAGPALSPIELMYAYYDAA